MCEIAQLHFNEEVCSSSAIRGKSLLDMICYRRVFLVSFGATSSQVFFE